MCGAIIDIVTKGWMRVVCVGVCINSGIVEDVQVLPSVPAGRCLLLRKGSPVSCEFAQG